MADTTLRRGAAFEGISLDLIIDWVVTHRALVALGAIMVVAALLRFWALDVKALHHDESLHAQFTWYLYDGGAYKHDPLMHGPFLFEAGAAVFFLFGDSDYTARILPALFGTALVGMPYLLRKQIGMRAVLIAAVLLTFSPTILYVSRFLRHDMYVSVFTLGMVICVWRYIDEKRNGWLYGLAGLLAFSFASMEVTFIHAAILIIFVDLMLAYELGRRRDDETIDDVTVALRTFSLVPVAWAVAALWPLLGKRPLGFEKLPAIGDVMVVMGTMILPQFAAGIQELPFIGDKGYQVPAEEPLRNVTVLVLMIASAYVGLMWRPKVWLACAACFYVPFVLMYTTFFMNPGGFWTGIWGSLDYWLDQHGVKRGGQPYYYYGMLTPVYEFLPLIFALAGSAWLVARGNAIKRWLVFWTIGIFIGLSVAGEKMPWLEVYIALPLALVGSVVIASMMDGVDLAMRHWRSVTAAALLTALAVMLIVPSGSFGLPRLLGIAMLAGMAGWGVLSFTQDGSKGLGRAVLVVSLAVLLTLSVRSAYRLSFTNPDVPVELAVYTQSSREIPELQDRIDALAKESGLGANLPVVVDGTDGFAWPWAWYLRDYHAVTYANPGAPNYTPPDGAVLIVAEVNASGVDSAGYDSTPFKHRWWFCESYRDAAGSCRTDGSLTPIEIAKKVTSVSQLSASVDYILHRRPAEGTTGSVNSVAFFPDSLSAFDIDRTPQQPAPEPVRLADGRIVIGRTGRGPGELSQPAGLYVDNAGQIWVADSKNGRLQAFDSSGRHLRSIGRSGTGAGSFNEPWSLAVADDGFIYVADTWNHRIEKFSPEGTFVKAWGEFGATSPGGSANVLYGPRDIVIAPDGTLWVTDTGNKRLVHYTTEGEALGTFGREGNAAGEFLEPVGLDYDAAGRLYVADAWNSRIQVFAPGLASSTSFSVGWKSQDVIAKPYIAVLSDGRILAAEPIEGLLLLFDAQGRALGSWRPTPDGVPLGVVATADGGFAFSDGTRNELQIVPAASMGALFK